jgi:trimethylamine--corrinoid protein Co-methyltransferase
VEADIPVVPALAVSMGGTGPATVAGAVVQQMAELMGWVTLIQLMRPGAPLAIHHGGTPLNMRTGEYMVSSPLRSLATTMINQMLRKYGIPSWVNSGWTSASKGIDFQAAYEKGLGALMGCLSGGNLILFQGGSCVELLYSSTLAIMDDDVAGWIGRVLEGPLVNDDTLALEVIDQVGPLPGNFLASPHTRQWYRVGQFIPKVADMTPYRSWLQTGKKDMLTLAKEKEAEILANHKPEPLSETQEKRIAEILNEARQFYLNRGDITADQWREYAPLIDTFR